MQKHAFILGLALVLSSGTYAQLNMNFLGNFPYTPGLNDIWGHVDSLGNEYALVGVQNGISVVDVTVPSAPSEVYFISGPNSTWRDIKVWNKHAYVTNESSGGLKIIDLSNLPDTTLPTVTTFSGSLYPFTSAHDIAIDENGVAYILGSDYGAGGAIMLDVDTDPMNPIELGVFNTYYLHDAMARGDTLWGAAINNGFFVVVDVSNKSAPSVLATQTTPDNFTHNCWISDDGNTLFTTDETSGAYITSYDVSNLSSITELDRIRSNPGSGVIVHNTFFMNDFVISSYYKDGVTVHDVTRPGNMIQTGYYDTYPSGSGNGFSGAWGVYPWLPSGNVLVSDIDNGLFILGSNYTKGCYLEGTVTDSATTNPINNATIEILVGMGTTTSNITGDYAMAILTAGTYSVVFSAPGYTADTLTAVLANGVLTILDVALVAPLPFALSGQVIEANGGNPIPGAEVLITNNDFTFALTSDGSGNFSIPTFFDGTYEVLGGKWLYKTTCFSQFIDSNTAPIVIALDSGLYDDFTFDLGWGISGNATTGIWVIGEPVGTNWIGVGDANPDVDVNTDCYDQAYVTGNGGGSVGNDDVDDGNTIVKSPLFDVTGYADPYVKYHRWFFNDGGSGTPNDTLTVRISNGIVFVVLEEVTESSPGNSSWVPKSFKISDYIAPTALMQLTFETADYAGTGHLVEAAIDLFQVEDYTVSLASINASCNGSCDAGAAPAIVGGVAPLTYLWDDPSAQTTDTAIGLCAGTYTLMVIDAAGDTASASVTITQPAAIGLSTATTPLCSPS
ncbi:choice-of-anchor B family protein, partial [Flavobacteriales bacterium AH-315-E23]|nr:choice-of-anchor B family protein [Flavobacteriales bacterium AH-315-E23]